jgi:DeoD family purine-nucleoside phosphorylase
MRKGPHFTPEKMASLLGLKVGSLAPIALIPGPKERSQMILEVLHNPTKSFSFLDYEMHTGNYNGTKVTVGNGGMYAPDTAITTEILCAGGVDSLIRIGSCGSLQEEVRIGDLVIVSGAVRGEGTTSYYVPKNFSTVSHPEIVRALTEAANSLEVRYHVGRVYTTDALFQETPELIEELNQQGVSAIDMVTSAFLTVAQVRNRKAGAILAVSDECLHGKMGFRDPTFLKAEEKMVEVALKAIHHFG